MCTLLWKAKVKHALVKTAILTILAQHAKISTRAQNRYHSHTQTPFGKTQTMIWDRFCEPMRRTCRVKYILEHKRRKLWQTLLARLKGGVLFLILHNTSPLKFDGRMINLKKSNFCFHIRGLDNSAVRKKKKRNTIFCIAATNKTFINAGEDSARQSFG